MKDLAAGRTPKLFVFEGPDGAGKTTLSQAFAEKLSSEGVDCEYFSFPGREEGSLGRHVYELHHGAHVERISTVAPASLQVLHVAAHIDAIESQIRPALAAGRVVVLDRFWWSTWVYGMIAGIAERSLRAMIALESVHWNEILPSAVFLLRRDGPLHPVPVERWDELSREYMCLADRESGRHPVFQITNQLGLSDALQEICFQANEILPSNCVPRGHGRAFQADLPFERRRAIGPITRTQMFSKMSPANPTIVYETYWRFATERQNIFFRRLRGQESPWTDDAILQQYKFTNVYRASDRVSQYLIKNVIYKGEQTPEELFFRTILFKIFNRIETWALLESRFGEVSYKGYSRKHYDDTLTEAIERNQRIYSAAYIMPSGGRSSASLGRKHRMHLGLVESMMRDDLPQQLCDAKTMAVAFELLRSYPTLGDFLAYQYVTDLNYSVLTEFSETEFVVPGPGARSGLQKCFRDLGGLNEAETIKMVRDRQEGEFEALGLSFQSLWGRPLQLIDCQNLFCEVDKYSRIKHPEFSSASGRTRIKQRYRAQDGPIEYWYPPKWGLNDQIGRNDVPLI